MVDTFFGFIHKLPTIYWVIFKVLNLLVAENKPAKVLPCHTFIVPMWVVRKNIFQFWVKHENLVP